MIYFVISCAFAFIAGIFTTVVLRKWLVRKREMIQAKAIEVANNYSHPSLEWAIYNDFVNLSHSLIYRPVGASIHLRLMAIPERPDVVFDVTCCGVSCIDANTIGIETMVSAWELRMLRAVTL